MLYRIWKFWEKSVIEILNGVAQAIILYSFAYKAIEFTSAQLAIK